MNRWIFALLLLPAMIFADDTRERTASPTSVIEDSICVPDISGQQCLHVDEDVANLVLEVLGEDGTQVALYDAGTELEDIATIGTYAAPSGSNVRVSPQGGATPDGPDLTQIMLADAVYAGENRITICISDGGVTIMDFCRTVEMNPVLATAALNTYDPPTDTEMIARTTTTAAYATSSAQTTAQNDLDLMAGTNGVLIDDTESAALVDEVWNELCAGHTTTDSTGDQLCAILDAIKAKTDGLTFTVAGEVDANAESMNAVEILGSGTAVDPWNGE